jgi:prepilin peptidase CpaA
LSVLADPVFGPLLGLGLASAAASDLLRRKVPNALNAALALAGFGWQWRSAGLPGLADGALGLLVGFALVIGPFALRLYRGGDAKLVIALGAWLGPARTAWTFLWGVAFGGLVAIGVLIVSRREHRARIVDNLRLAAGTATLPAVEPDRPARLHVPMALAFGAGAVAALLWGSA